MSKAINGLPQVDDLVEEAIKIITIANSLCTESLLQNLRGPALKKLKACINNHNLYDAEMDMWIKVRMQQSSIERKFMGGYNG